MGRKEQFVSLHDAGFHYDAVGATETMGLTRAQDRIKRGIDIVLAPVILAVVLPVMVLAALAILVLDGRPVLFRQKRVGRHGGVFTMYKFRTMVPDAENRLIDLRDVNERKGPLFKLSSDPRVTRVGRILRESSIDELPQLFNVIRGTMSLVGPRPALPDETVHFGEELLDRHLVRPGITGLWQVHSRDEPSFDSYQRLDLDYVENWSLSMDAVILAKTVPTVIRRTYHRLSRPRRPRAVAAAASSATAPEVVPLSVVPSAAIRLFK